MKTAYMSPQKDTITRSSGRFLQEYGSGAASSLNFAQTGGNLDISQEISPYLNADNHFKNKSLKCIIKQDTTVRYSHPRGHQFPNSTVKRNDLGMYVQPGL